MTNPITHPYALTIKNKGKTETFRFATEESAKSAYKLTKLVNGITAIALTKKVGNFENVIWNDYR